MRRGQRGAALLLVLLAVLVTAGYAGMRGLNAAYAKSDRDARTLAALQQAKQALLGYAVNRSRLYGSSPTPLTLDPATGTMVPSLANVPGALPCPAQATLLPSNVNYGSARTTCAASFPSFPNLLIGRLPWKTLEIPELADATGEPLWYAVSSSFRFQTGMAPINPDSRGRIQIVDRAGNVTQDRVVAVVIAPGRTLPGQSRSIASATEFNAPANFLERFGVYLVSGVDMQFYGGPPTNATPAVNDILVTITEGELQDAIANAVAARIEQTVLPLLEAHRVFWGTLPFATGSFDPTQPAANLTGTAGALTGHLPVGALTGVQFSGAAKQSGTAAVTCTQDTRLTCTVGSSPMGTTPETFVIRATLSNVNRGVFNPLTPLAALPANLAMVIAATPVSGTADADIVITGTVTGQAGFTLEPRQRLQAAAPDSAARPQEWWFDYPGWARFVHYSRCTDAAVACLSVQQTASAAQPARAVLLVAGGPVMKPDLSAQTRPSANAADYFEPPHDTLPPSTFRRQLRSPTFNDRVVMLP